jgi:hypothetical protein
LEAFGDPLQSVKVSQGGIALARILKHIPMEGNGEQRFRLLTLSVV